MGALTVQPQGCRQRVPQTTKTVVAFMGQRVTAHSACSSTETHKADPTARERSPNLKRMASQLPEPPGQRKHADLLRRAAAAPCNRVGGRSQRRSNCPRTLAEGRLVSPQRPQAVAKEVSRPPLPSWTLWGWSLFGFSFKFYVLVSYALGLVPAAACLE